MAESTAPAAPERSVCQSWNCGVVFDGLDRFCPTCGNRAVPQKRIRMLGGVLIVCGLFLVGMIGAISWYMLPVMYAGPRAEGTGFTGTRADANVITALLAGVILFGTGALVAGYTQLRHGRQDWKLVGGMLAVLAVVCVIVWLIATGVLLPRA